MDERVDVVDEILGEERSLEENLEHYWKVFRRRWKIAMLVLLVTVLVMMVPAYRKVPVYRAHGTLMISN